MANLGFEVSNEIYNQDNLSPYYGELAWKCRKLKKARKIYNWSFRNESILIKRTENENARLILHNDDIEFLYPNFDYSV